MESTAEPDEQEVADPRRVLTYSGESAFTDCRQLYKFRYVDQLVPRGEDDEPLFMGSLWHALAEIRDALLHRGLTREVASAWARAYLAHVTQGRVGDKRKRMAWLVLGEAFDEHERRYGPGARPPLGPADLGELPTAGAGAGYLWVCDDQLELVEIETARVVDLVNPATGKKSRTFRSGLKIDALVRNRRDGRLYLHERKLLSDLGDIERLWTDYQLARYAKFVGDDRGEQLAGSIYDVAIKPKIRVKEAYLEPEGEWRGRVQAKIQESQQKLIDKSETLEAWQARVDAKVNDEVAKAEAKGKPFDREAIREKVLGLVSMKRKEATEEDLEREAERVRAMVSMQREDRKAETDDEFRARLRDHFAKQFVFVRVMLPFDPQIIEDAGAIAWEAANQVRDAHNRNVWRKNLRHCYHHYGRTCPYIAACRDHKDPGTDPVLSMYFEKKPANVELLDSPLESWVDPMIRDGFDPFALLAEANSREESARNFFGESDQDARASNEAEPSPF